MKRNVIFLSAFGLLSVSYTFGAFQQTTVGNLKQEATQQVIVEDQITMAAKKKKLPVKSATEGKVEL